MNLIQPFRANMRLGYMIDGNWTHPLLYLLYSLIAPFSGVLRLVFMYILVLGASRETSFLAFMLTGSALFLYVRLVLTGAGFAVIEDREHYRILRYIYIAPTPFPVQIFGRIMFKLLIGTVGVIATFSAGHLIIGIPFRHDGIQWGVVFGSTVIGLLGIASLGWILAGCMLIVDRMGWIWAEGFSGLLFLTSGAVIPLNVLPPAIQWVGLILPVSYWADLWRTAFFGEGVVMAMEGLSPSQLGIRLLVTTMVWGIISIVWHKLCDRIARRWGRIEAETFY